MTEAADDTVLKLVAKNLECSQFDLYSQDLRSHLFSKVVCHKCDCLSVLCKSLPHLRVPVVLLTVVCEVTWVGFGVYIADSAFSSLAQFAFVPAGLLSWVTSLI